MANGDIYQKSGGVWSVVGNVAGPTGVPGATGPTGPQGTGGSPSTNDFRLTLVSGVPLVNLLTAVPSSTNTVTGVVTFATDPAWPTGTIATISATASGLTNHTRYFLGRLSSTTYAFYTTAANAFADSSRVTLSANVTATVQPSGVTSRTVYLTPFKGQMIALFDGVSAWGLQASAEVSLALGTLVSATNYDVFAFVSGGVLTLEAVAWTDNVTRATALVRQDGIWVKSGTTSKRYVGTFRTNTTTETITDAGGITSQVGGQWFLYNADNRLNVGLRVSDFTNNWTYTSATIRQANAATGNKIEVVFGLAENFVDASLTIVQNTGGGGALSGAGIGVDVTTAFAYGGTQSGASTNAGVSAWSTGHAHWAGPLAPGYHFVAWLEQGGGTNSTNFGGLKDGSLSGLIAVLQA